jgi:glyoxylase-like metal-dependent hydrolase (beta-lactamase superfamily II)
MKISPSCYALTGFGFTPPWSVNAGFIVGEKTTLVVDTGPSAFAARTILGYARAVRPANLLRAINTEPHMDHILGNGVFADEGIEILGHSAIHRAEADFAAALAEYQATIPDPVRRAAGEEQCFFAGTRLVNPTARVEGEINIELGGLAARIIPAPGHTPSNMLVWAEAEGVLFCGDTIVAGYRPNLESGRPADWLLWQDALRSIEALHPKIIVPGHGPVLDQNAIPQAIRRMREFLEQTL